MIALMSEPTKKRNRKSRGANSMTYRLIPEVIQGVKYTADMSNRSDNKQAEYLLKLGILTVLDVDVKGLTDLDIQRRFDEIAKLFPVDNQD